MIKAVIFDLDGTLVNSLSDLANSTNYALGQMGFNSHETDKYKYFVGNGMLKLIERVLPENKRDEETISKCLEIFMEHYRTHYADSTYAYEGMNELIGSLKAMGMKIAVVSNKAQEMTDVIVNKLFGDVFNVVAGKRTGYPAKPDPTLTLEIIRQLALKPDECIFAGDSGIDAATAVNSGCIGIGVLWGFRTREELTENGAVYTVSHPDEIIDVIKGLNNGYKTT